VYALHDMGPHALLAEAAHLELQFELRDTRAGAPRPVLRFGYDTDKVRGRFVRGALCGHAFACGDAGGAVRFWDVRHAARPARVVRARIRRRVGRR
jgi:hypothetical protein